MTYSINFTEQELALVFSALAELPYKISAQVMSNVQTQVTAANANADAAPGSAKTSTISKASSHRKVT